MQEQLENSLRDHGFLDYDMLSTDYENFWDFWQKNGKPPVSICKIYPDLSYRVPGDAVVTIEDRRVNQAELHSLEHVVDLSCYSIRDYDAAGYTGHAKIRDITLTQLSHDAALPKCNRYALYLRKGFDDSHVFDCKGASLNAVCMILYQGMFADIARCFTNYTSIIIQGRMLNQLCEEAPEIAANPNITVNMIAFVDFNSDIFAGKFIANLILRSYGKIVVTHDPNTDICIANIVEYDKCFEEFVHSISMRFKRTKRCVS